MGIVYQDDDLSLQNHLECCYLFDDVHLSVIPLRLYCFAPPIVHLLSFRFLKIKNWRLALALRLTLLELLLLARPNPLAYAIQREHNHQVHILHVQWRDHVLT